MVGAFTVRGVKGNVVLASRITPQYARGCLKARGSDDPDIVAMVRTELLEETRTKRMYAWIFLVLGVVLAPTIIGLALTVVFVPFGLWGLARAKANERTVDAAIEDVRAGR